MCQWGRLFLSSKPKKGKIEEKGNMKKKLLLIIAAASLLLISAFAPTVLTWDPWQPPVVTSTLHVGRDGWVPGNADPITAPDKYSQELIFNAYDRLVMFGENVTNPRPPEQEWVTYEQYWEFSPCLATNVPDRQEVVMVIPDTEINPFDPVCYWFEALSVTPPEFAVNPFYHINGWVDNNPDGILGPCDVLYIGEYLVLMEPESIVTKRTWHVVEYVPGDHVTVHHYYYDFVIRIDPVVYFVDESGGVVDTFDIFDAEYSLERGLVQDPYGGPMWKFYKPFFDQMNSDFWDTGDPADAFELSYLIEDAVEIISLDPPVLRINIGIPFPDGPIDKAFEQIMCGTWASIVSREFSISIGCWDGDLFSDVNPANGYPDWWDNCRHVEPSPYDANMRYVGTGPYYASTVSAMLNLVVLDRNTLYWRGWPAPQRKSYLDSIYIEYISSWATRRDAFIECVLDICDVPRAYMMELLDPTDPAKMKTLYPEMVTIKNISLDQSLEALIYTFVARRPYYYFGTGNLTGGLGIPSNFFNCTHVRYAFSYAFDSFRYLSEMWMWEVRACRETPLISCLVPDYYSKAPDPPYRFDYNYTKCKHHLKNAFMNATGGTEGTVDSVWNWGFTLTLVYDAGNDQRRFVCEMIRDFFANMSGDAERWGKPPFIISVVEVSRPTYLAQFESGMIPICVMSCEANYADADAFERPFMHSYGYFASTQKYTCSNGWITFGPRTGLTKDVLIDLALKTPDGPLRADMYADLDDIYLIDCPSLPIAEPKERKWLKYWVRGWYHNALYPSDYYYHLYKMDTCWADVTGLEEAGKPDGVCNMRDIGYICARFGAKAPDPTRVPPYDMRWAPGTYGMAGADAYGDRKIGVVDMRDIGIACAHFLHEDEP